MKRSRFSEEQIIAILKEQETGTAGPNVDAGAIRLHLYRAQFTRPLPVADINDAAGSMIGDDFEHAEPAYRDSAAR